MRVTLTFDKRKLQERELLRQYVKLAQPATRRPPTNSFLFSWLELDVNAALRGLEAGGRRLVCAIFPHKATQRR